LVPAGALLGSELSQEDEEDEEGLPKERERERERGDEGCTRRRREWVFRSNTQGAIAVDDGKTKRKNNNNKQGSISSPTVERRSSREMPMKNRFGV
jgi:hypothetical protein